jgi:hypothetical protein
VSTRSKKAHGFIGWETQRTSPLAKGSTTLAREVCNAQGIRR